MEKKKKFYFLICMIVILDVSNSELPISIFFGKQNPSRFIEGVYTSFVEQNFSDQN